VGIIVWLIRIDLLRVACLLIARWGRKPAHAEVIRWLVALGMRWLGDDVFVSTNAATESLDDDQIIESVRVG
jgi:hypothetical protein